MKRILGSCSKCGGRVTVPKIWHGVNPPTPSCDSCHSIPVDTKPVIQMK